jgi:hypothetical protein
MDDMIVKSTTETEHKAHLNAVSQKCDKTIWGSTLKNAHSA